MLSLFLSCYFVLTPVSFHVLGFQFGFWQFLAGGFCPVGWDPRNRNVCALGSSIVFLLFSRKVSWEFERSFSCTTWVLSARLQSPLRLARLHGAPHLDAADLRRCEHRICHCFPVWIWYGATKKLVTQSLVFPSARTTATALGTCILIVWPNKLISIRSRVFPQK